MERAAGNEKPGSSSLRARAVQRGPAPRSPHMSEDPRGADTHASAPTPLPRHNKHEFVRTSLEAGKVPTAPMLEALVQELRPHLISRRRRCDAASIFKVILKSLGARLPSLGWIVASNSPAPGSAPRGRPRPRCPGLSGQVSALAECAAKTGEFPVHVRTCSFSVRVAVKYVARA